MYGTIAKMKLKPGMEAKMMAETKSYESLNIPGFLGTMVYKMDTNPNEYYMTVVFADKDAYSKNANNPEQDKRYRAMLEMLVGEPEWHDGEIVYSTKM